MEGLEFKCDSDIGPQHDSVNCSGGRRIILFSVENECLHQATSEILFELEENERWITILFSKEITAVRNKNKKINKIFIDISSSFGI